MVGGDDLAAVDAEAAVDLVEDVPATAAETIEEEEDFSTDL